MWCNVGFAECIEGDCINGYGTYTTDGSKYVGEFKDGLPHGQGTFIGVNGNKYVGEHKNGKMNGQGTFTWASGEFAGNKYAGEFKDNERHGQGTYTFANGEKYVGEWKDGEPNGQGTHTFTNGDKYVGEFKNGSQHGQGIYTYADGTVEKGIWENGKLIKRQTASSTEINNVILKCADYEHTQDMKQNFFKYMILMVSENYSENEKDSISTSESSNRLHQIIIITSRAGYSEQEIIKHLKDKQEKGTSDFESLEEKDKLLILSIRQNYDYWIESLNLFLRKSPVEKREDNRYGIRFLTCESKAKKDADSFVEKYSNIN